MPTPTRIIEPRMREAPCCGGSFIQNQLIFGDGGPSTPPCTPTSIEQVVNGDFSSALSGWTVIDIGFGISAYLSAGRLTYDDGNTITEGYFQPINFDSTKEYIFSIEKIDTGSDPPPTIFIAEQSIDGNSTFGLISGVNGSFSGAVHPAAWIAGPSSLFATYGLGPTDYGVLLVFSTNGVTFGGGYIDNISFTLEECI